MATWIALIYALWLARLFIIIGLAITHKKASNRRADSAQTILKSFPKQPLVTIVIPAFNEYDCIASSISSCQKSNYSKLEIIVIDDGSTDETCKQVDAMQIKHASQPLRLIRQRSNQGKAEALNRGIDAAQGSIIVTLDADTRFEQPETLETLILPLLVDPDLAATTASLRVNQRRRFWSSVQDLEYTNVLHTIKRAQCRLKGIMILPGAMSAFRLKDLRASGGFSSQTLAEDADITMQFLLDGKQQLFQADAIAFTDAPITLRELMHQRIRWRVGQLQCLRKHQALLHAAPFQRLIYLDTVATNLLSLATPVLILMLLTSGISATCRVEQLVILNLMSIVAVGWGTTALCYRLDDRLCPQPIRILGYFCFFSIFNPIITLIALWCLIKSRLPCGRTPRPA